MPGTCLAEKRHALDPDEEIVSLSPPGRAALILNTEVAAYEAATEFAFRPNHSGSWSPTERKERHKLARQIPSDNVTLEIVHAHGAGIDVGKDTHYVAVPPDRDAKPVQSFDSCTDGLQQMVAWLKKCGITSVALQSTGVYWIALYDILQEADFEVYLVNARYTKSLPGRKSDVQESQWLMKLHTYGLLPNSFRPPQAIRWLRSYWRQRQNHVRSAATCIHRMDKILIEMNVRLSSAVTDLSGATGLAMVQAIVKGKRDPQGLAAYRDPRVKATREESRASSRAIGKKTCCFAWGRSWRLIALIKP